MRELERKLGYQFKNRALLEQALTHSSYANENKKSGRKCNERLEFLGDAVLGLAVADYLFQNCPDMPEGDMSRMRADMVCEANLVRVAERLELGKHLYLGHGEELGGGRQRPSILADATEAVLAAVYLDGGQTAAEKIILRYILSPMEAGHQPQSSDFKTALQELVQKKSGQTITYALLGESGPDHNKEFTAEVRLNGLPAGTGTGHNKKEAEQEAARKALEELSR